MGPKRQWSSRRRATARLTPTRPKRPSCRESSEPGAMPRECSFAGCTSACRAAGGRRAGTTLRPSAHVAGGTEYRWGGAVAAWMRRPRRAPRIVLLVDGSRSMTPPHEPRCSCGRAGECHHAGRGVHVLDGAPTCDRRGASGLGRRVRHLDHLHHAWAGGPPSARAFATSCGGSVNAW